MTLKKQTGIWIDDQVWGAYRDLCRREKLRPAEPVEEYVRFVLSERFGVGCFEHDAGCGKGEV
jgi:hypothetical protein